jgi:hypothetical protein
MTSDVLIMDELNPGEIDLEITEEECQPEEFDLVDLMSMNEEE